MSRPKDERLFVRVSIDLPGNPKLVDANPATKWLDVCGWIVSGRELLDGVIRPTVALAEADVPARHARDLIKRGRWHEPGHECDRCHQPPTGHVVIHDYLEHQQSRAEAVESKRKKSAAGKKGAATRWDGNRYGTRHNTSDGKPDGKVMADTDTDTDNVVQLSSQSPSARAELDDDGLTRIQQALNNCPKTHAKKTATFVLAKAPADVRNPVAYILAAIREDPGAFRYKRGNPKRDQECATHAGEWVDACRGCAIDRKVGNA